MSLTLRCTCGRIYLIDPQDSDTVFFCAACGNPVSLQENNAAFREDSTPWSTPVAAGIDGSGAASADGKPDSVEPESEPETEEFRLMETPEEVNERRKTKAAAGNLPSGNASVHVGPPANERPKELHRTSQRASTDFSLQPGIHATPAVPTKISMPPPIPTTAGSPVVGFDPFGETTGPQWNATDPLRNTIHRENAATPTPTSPPQFPAASNAGARKLTGRPASGIPTIPSFYGIPQPMLPAESLKTDTPSAPSIPPASKNGAATSLPPPIPGAQASPSMPPPPSISSSPQITAHPITGAPKRHSPQKKNPFVFLPPAGTGSPSASDTAGAMGKTADATNPANEANVTPGTDLATSAWERRRQNSRNRKLRRLLAATAVVATLVIIANLVVPLLPLKPNTTSRNGDDIKTSESDPSGGTTKNGHDGNAANDWKTTTSSKTASAVLEDGGIGIRRYPENGQDIEKLIDELPPTGGVLIISSGVQKCSALTIDRPLRLIGSGQEPSETTLEGDAAEFLTIAPGVKGVEIQRLTLRSTAAQAGQTLRIRDGAAANLSQCVVQRTGGHPESVALRSDPGSRLTANRCEFGSDSTAMLLECGPESVVQRSKITGGRRGIVIRGDAAPTVRILEMAKVRVGIEFADGAEGTFDQVTITDPRETGFDGISGVNCVVERAKISLSAEGSVGLRFPQGSAGTFRDIQIDAGDINGSGGGETGVLLCGGRPTLEKVTVTGGRYGVILENGSSDGNTNSLGTTDRSDSATLQNCRLTKSATAGVLVRETNSVASEINTDTVTASGNATRAVFSRCEFSDGMDAGIRIRSGGARFEECDISGNRRVGVAIAGTGGGELIRCRFTAQRGDAPGVTVETEPGIASELLDGCTFEAMNDSGIEVHRGNVRIVRCTFSRGRKVGAMLLPDGSGEFTDCVFQEHLLAGVQIESLRALTFTRCRFLRNENGVLIRRDSASRLGFFDQCEFLSNVLSGAEIRGSGGLVKERTSDGDPPDSGILFVGCTLGNNGGSGALCVERDSQPEFRSCRFEQNLGSGVVASDHAWITLRDSTITDSNYGVRVYGGGGGVAENNTLLRIRRRLFVIEKDAGTLIRSGNQPADE